MPWWWLMTWTRCPIGCDGALWKMRLIRSPAVRVTGTTIAVKSVARLKPLPLRQRLQQCLRRLHGSNPRRVAPGNPPVDAAPMVLDTCDVAAAAQDQRLIDCGFEVPVPGFHRPVRGGFTAENPADMFPAAVEHDEGTGQARRRLACHHHARRVSTGDVGLAHVSRPISPGSGVWRKIWRKMMSRAGPLSAGRSVR